MNDRRILIIGEMDEDRLKPVTFELAALAGQLNDGQRDGVLLVLIGSDPEKAAGTAAEATGLDVLSVTVTGVPFLTGDIRKDVIAAETARLNPSYILCAHSAEGADYAPGLAVRLSASCISAVNGMVKDADGTILFSRSICGGQYNAFLKPQTDRAVVMVQPGLFQPGPKAVQPGRIIRETFAVQKGRVRMTGVEKSRESSSELGQAKVIVSAGRGIGAPENLTAIRRFAALFPGSAVGGSRPLIDAGWLEYRHQVGITGATVSPAVYIACGISGSTQHIAGMNTSGYVVAINSDPYAAIFNFSDLCIVDDILGFIDAFEDYVTEE